MTDDQLFGETDFEEENQRLRRENEQLKEERNYFERKKCEYFNKYNKKHLDNIQLKEENEQLKKARDESDKFIAKKGLGAEFLEWCVENE